MPKSWEDENQIIDLSNINPNKMFALSYNFELLKYVITSLIRNQQNFDNKLNDLKLSFLKKQIHSIELEIDIIELKMQREELPEVLEELLKQKKELNLKKEQYQKELELLEKEIEEDKNPKKIPIYNMKEPKKVENIQEFAEEIIITDLNTAQKNITSEEEKEDDKIEIKEKENEKEKESEKKNEKEEEEKEKQNENEQNKKENEENDEENEQNEKENQQNEKENQQNEKEIEKEKESEKDEKKDEEIIEEEKKEEKNEIPPPATIVTTQPKTTENNKEKNTNEDFHKELQLIVGELKNMKTKQQNMEKEFSIFKSNITEQIKEKMGNEIPSMINNTFENKIILIQKNNKKDIDKINEDINNMNNTFDQKIADLKANLSKEISLNDEKNKLEFEQIKNNYTSLKESLSLTNEKLLNVVTILSFNNLKKEINEKFESEKKIINLELSIIKSSLTNVKNQLYDHLSDSRDHDNLVRLMKIMDSISMSIQKLMDFKKAFEEKDKRKAIIDNSKYVKQEGFNEAINNIHKHMDSNKKEVSEMRIDIDNIRTKDLNIKANLRDLKNLEDSVLTKMETLKETIRDKFVEKNMLVKNLKYLELQTKQIIEENKKSDKPENWLLAKKPFNGHLCASCEAYLGDLKPITNSKYIAWNKYPAKESIEKIFRINAGFSKVLQMVNQDKDRNERSKSNSLNNSKEERNCSSAEGEKRKMEKIPNYKNKNLDKLLRHNNSSTQIDDNDFVGTLPKISVKKSTKLSSDNIFSEERNKTLSNKVYNTGKGSANPNTRKSRKLVEDDENGNNINKKNEDNEEKNEFQKPKITKVFRKIADCNTDKKENNNKK